MKVGIIGAGGIACATSALLLQRGHAATLWSPSGAGTAALADGVPLRAEGALEGNFRPVVATSARAAVEGMDAVLLAAPAPAHRKLLDAIAPFVAPGQCVIISAHYSFAALYLARLLAARGIEAPVVAWGTTVLTGRLVAAATVRISTLRGALDMAALPARLAPQAQATCTALFGERFIRRPGGLLAITLSNVNPQNHMALTLTNLTRIECGEDWAQFRYYTPAVGALVEALDAERLAVAAACGCKVRSVFEHLHLSYHVPMGPVSQMLGEMFARGGGGLGPRSLDTRYITEDVPFGLAVTALLGRKAGCPAPLHEAGIALLSALRSQDLAAQNDLLEPLGLARLSLDALRTEVGAREEAEGG